MEDKKAIRTKMKKALEEFSKNDYWKEYYEGAPSDKCKEYINLSFCWSIPKYDDESFTERQKRIFEELEIKDLNYLREHAPNKRMRCICERKIREKKQSKTVAELEPFWHFETAP